MAEGIEINTEIRVMSAGVPVRARTGSVSVILKPRCLFLNLSKQLKLHSGGRLMRR